ncbi:MAG: haloacid dehalogenase [Anaerolineales bacterium]|nr:haloacid dehalogenase [Anaerolineales bacterium]
MLESLDRIGEDALVYFDKKNQARENALKQSRTLIRHCSLAIRAVHRDERTTAKGHIQEAEAIVSALKSELSAYPDLYHAGYTRDALKEYAEANISYALIGGDPLPTPEELDVDYAPYLGGLGEAAGELRRRVLDMLRDGYSRDADRLLDAMDEIYSLLVTVDYPDAITGSLRRTTDLVRGVTKRTRDDLTTSAQFHDLKQALKAAGMDVHFMAAED